MAERAILIVAAYEKGIDDAALFGFDLVRPVQLEISFEMLCQFVEARFVADTKTKLVYPSGQETVRTSLLRSTARLMPAWTQVFSKTETLPDLSLATARSGLPSPLKSPTATDRGIAMASGLSPTA